MAAIKRLDNTIITENDSMGERELVRHCLENFITLNEANLDNLNLSGLNFNDAFIKDASFKNADLSGISSKNATFIHCDFSGANFNFCNFLNTEFENCILDNISLRDCIGDMKHIFTIAIDTYVMTFTKTMMNLGCNAKSIEEWRKLNFKDLEDEEQSWLFECYKDIIFQIIDKRLEVLND